MQVRVNRCERFWTRKARPKGEERSDESNPVKLPTLTTKRADEERASLKIQTNDKLNSPITDSNRPSEAPATQRTEHQRTLPPILRSVAATKPRPAHLGHALQTIDTDPAPIRLTRPANARACVFQMTWRARRTRFKKHYPPTGSTEEKPLKNWLVPLAAAIGVVGFRAATDVNRDDARARSSTPAI